VTRYIPPTFECARLNHLLAITDLKHLLVLYIIIIIIIIIIDMFNVAQIMSVIARSTEKMPEKKKKAMIIINHDK